MKTHLWFCKALWWSWSMFYKYPLGSPWLERSSTNMRCAHICYNSGHVPCRMASPFINSTALESRLAAVELESIIQCFFFFLDWNFYLPSHKKEMVGFKAVCAQGWDHHEILQLYLMTTVRGELRRVRFQVRGALNNRGTSFCIPSSGN